MFANQFWKCALNFNIVSWQGNDDAVWISGSKIKSFLRKLELRLFRENKVISGNAIDRLSQLCKDRLLCYMSHVKISSYLCLFPLIQIHYFVSSKYVYHFSENPNTQFTKARISWTNNFDFNPFVFHQKIAFSLQTIRLIHTNDKKHKSREFFIIKLWKSIPIADYLADLIKKGVYKTTILLHNRMQYDAVSKCHGNTGSIEIFMNILFFVFFLRVLWGHYAGLSRNMRCWPFYNCLVFSREIQFGRYLKCLVYECFFCFSEVIGVSISCFCDCI